MIEHIQSEPGRNNIWRTLVLALAQAGQFEQARAIIEDIQDVGVKAEAMSALAGALAQADQLEQAAHVFRATRVLIDDIQDDSEKQHFALRALAAGLAQAKQFEQAQAVIDTIRDKYELRRGSAQSALVTALINAGKLKRARAVATTIHHSAWWAPTLHDLAVALVQNEQAEQAEEILRMMREKIDQIPRDDRSTLGRASALRSLALAFARTGKQEEAAAVFHHVHAVVLGPNQYERDDLNETISDLVSVLAHKGYFDTARTVADHIADPGTRSSALHSMTVSLAEAGHYRRAHETAESVQLDWMRASALRELVKILIETEQYDQAQALIDTLQDVFWQTKALSDLAIKLAQSGQEKQAAVAFSRAYSTSNHIQNIVSRATALESLVTALIQAEQYERFPAIIMSAHQVARSIPDKKHQARALHNLANSLIQAEYFDQAHAVIDDIQDADLRSQAKHNLAADSRQTEHSDTGLTSFQTTEKVIYYLERRPITTILAKAKELAEAGQTEQAEAVFRLAESAAKEIQPKHEQSMPLMHVALALTEVEYYPQAYAVAVDIKDRRWRAYALGKVTAHWVEHGDAVKAFAAIDDDLALNDFIRVIAFWGLPPTALREIIRITGWHCPNWREVQELLTAEADEE